MSQLVEEIRVRQVVREESRMELRVACALRRRVLHPWMEIPANKSGFVPALEIAGTRMKQLGAPRALEYTQRVLIALRKVRQRGRAATRAIPRAHKGEV